MTTNRVIRTPLLLSRASSWALLLTLSLVSSAATAVARNGFIKARLRSLVLGAVTALNVTTAVAQTTKIEAEAMTLNAEYQVSEVGTKIDAFCVTSDLSFVPSGTIPTNGSPVVAPSFTPGGGTYATAQTVTIVSATSGATIRYTIDGTNPTQSVGTVYKSPVSIGSTTTLKAIAYKSGMTDSAVTSAIYTINSNPGGGDGPYGPIGSLPYQERFDEWRKGRWEAKNGTNTWSSPVITIEGKHQLKLSLDYEQGGTNAMEATDTFVVWYEINGVRAAQDLVNVNGEFPTAIASRVICVENVNLQIKMQSVTNSTSELHFADNIRVEAPQVGAIITIPPMPAYTPPPAPATPTAGSGVIQYATTPRYNPNPNFTVKVNNVPIPVDDKFDPAESPVLDPTAKDYRLAIARLAFDFTQNPTATVQVTASQNIGSYTISPQNPSVFGLASTAYYTNVAASNSTLTFSVKQPRNMLLKINDLHYLMIFIDPPEVNPPVIGAANVISLAEYMNPDRDRNSDVTGQVQQALDEASATAKILYVPNDLYMCGQLVVKSNTHVYLQSGAMIQAMPFFNSTLYPPQSTGDSSFIYIGDRSVTMQNLAATKVSNVMISGRGTIDGNGWRLRYYNDNSLVTANVKLLRMANADNVHIKDIYLRDSARWTVHPLLSTNITVDGVKMINNVVGYFDVELGFHMPYVTNTDGYDIDTSSGVHINNVFIFTGDDAYTPKTTGYMALTGTCRDISMKNSTMWSEKVAMKIGNETKDDIYNVTFDNNHVIRADRLVSLLSEANNDVSINNVKIWNTRTEYIGGNSKKRFFLFRMLKTGAVHTIDINGVHALERPAMYSSSEGFDSTNRITGVTGANFKIAGAVANFGDIFRWIPAESAYNEFVHSVWTWNGTQYVGGVPLP